MAYKIQPIKIHESCCILDGITPKFSIACCACMCRTVCVDQCLLYQLVIVGHWTEWSTIQIERVNSKSEERKTRRRFEILSNNVNKIIRYLVIESKGTNTIAKLKT